MAVQTKTQALRPQVRKRYAVPITSEPTKPFVREEGESRVRCTKCGALILPSARLIHNKGHSRMQKEQQRKRKKSGTAFHYREVQGGLPSLGKKR